MFEFDDAMEVVTVVSTETLPPCFVISVSWDREATTAAASEVVAVELIGKPNPSWDLMVREGMILRAQREIEKEAKKQAAAREKASRGESTESQSTLAKLAKKAKAGLERIL
ncbi:hypothetical protein HDU93_003164 [Gonapodya sp. JEL0774]|nr:hypothetical protein HDU93_003164 [Gonapodya sp. JEL0774]